MTVFICWMLPILIVLELILLIRRYKNNKLKINLTVLYTAIAILFAISLAAAVILFKMSKMTEKSRTGTASTQLSLLAQAISDYKLDTKSFPSENDGFNALFINPGIDNWNGPYLLRKMPSDPWGTSFRYRLIDGKPVIDSAGPDKRYDTKDDLKAKEESNQSPPGNPAPPSS